MHESIYDEFVEKFVAQAKSWTVGPPRQATTKVGALVSEMHYNKVKSMLDLGKEENFTIFGHGLVDVNENLPEENKNGFFISPTGLLSIFLFSFLLFF